MSSLYVHTVGCWLSHGAKFPGEKVVHSETLAVGGQCHVVCSLQRGHDAQWDANCPRSVSGLESWSTVGSEDAGCGRSVSVEEQSTAQTRYTVRRRLRLTSFFTCHC